MKVIEVSDYKNYSWYFITETGHIYLYHNKTITKYEGEVDGLKSFFGSVLLTGECRLTNISDDLDLHFQHIAEQIETLDRDHGSEDVFKSINAVYTGGGIWLFYGQLTSGDYFLVDDNGCIIVLDESPEDFDVSLYDSWQERHFIRWIEGQEQKVFLHSMIDRVGKRLPVDDSGGITDDELDTLNDLWRYTA